MTEILRIGVPVGSEQWIQVVNLSEKEASVKREAAIEKAVSRIMVGDEAEEMRSRAIELGQMARRAVGEGGSSFLEWTALVEELNLFGPKCINSCNLDYSKWVMGRYLRPYSMSDLSLFLRQET